jgi:predicted MPP superfamily phosphohydrolase
MKHLQIIAIGTVSCVIFLYSLLIEPNWVEVNNWSRSIGLGGEAITVVQVSDLHTSGYGKTEEHVIQALRSIQPDVILFTGDVIDEKGSIPALRSFLKQLPKAVKVATLGNWEYWSDVDLKALEDVYRENEVMLLVNECLTVQVKGQKISIVGIDDYTAGKPEPTKALGNCELGHPVLIATHSPGLFDLEPPVSAKGISLIVAGHTHGGQLAIGNHALYTPRGSGTFVSGWYKTKWGELYVSRGVGTSVLPLRFGARPEVSVFELN